MLDQTIDSWLIEHYSGARKLGVARRWALKLAERDHAGLAPPQVPVVYRGLANVAPGQLQKLASTPLSQPRDVSWTTSRVMAARFTTTEFTRQLPVAGSFAVLLTAVANPTQLVLDANMIAMLRPRVRDFYHRVWRERLLQTIVAEQETLAIGPLVIVSVEAVPMTPF